MTLCFAWERSIPEVGKQLVIATDSMITGGFDYPCGTKLFPFNRKDCAICWEGESEFPYMMISNIQNDINFSDILYNSNTILNSLAFRIRDVFNELWEANLADKKSNYHNADFSFLFGGYCRQQKRVIVWHIKFSPDRTRFIAEEVSTTSPYFIGSERELAYEINQFAKINALITLKTIIDNPKIRETGGSIQLVTIDHTGLTPIGFYEDNHRYFFGKRLNSSGHRSNIRFLKEITEL